MLIVTRVHAGVKCEDDVAKASIWTLQAARGVSRKRTSRALQKDICREDQKRMRSEADAKHRGDTANKDRRLVYLLFYLLLLCVLCKPGVTMTDQDDDPPNQNFQQNAIPKARIGGTYVQDQGNEDVN